jgi:hypothetical protein
MAYLDIVDDIKEFISLTENWVPELTWLAKEFVFNILWTDDTTTKIFTYKNRYFLIKETGENLYEFQLLSRETSEKITKILTFDNIQRYMD